MSQKVTSWLEELGLGQYADAFQENELDLDQLVDLSNEDLKDLGVTIMGHRKKLFRAIETLSLEFPAEISQGDDSSLSEPPLASAAGEAERRQLTVMFCDLVGSTELSQQFDPEDLQTMLASYQAACNTAIERFDGYVARYMGDGMLVYFGYPLAHEDDAERAVRAGLGIIEEVASLDLSFEVELSVRVGIATGLVVAGDIVGEGASEERTVLGETPNLAARLQGIAPPGGVIIADSTRRLVEGRVEVETLEPVSLKGFRESVQAFRAIGIHVASRFDASSSDSLTPFVARSSELNLLTDRWQQACSGDGQVVLLSGEAGIGKSRILHELRDLLGTSAHVSIRFQCSPFNSNTPFFPIIEQLRLSVGIAKSDTDENRLDKLEQFIGETTGNVGNDAPRLAALMQLPLERYPPLELSPARQKAEIIGVLVDLLVHFSRNSPLIVFVEDIHWIDPSTLEVFDAFVDALQTLPVMLVLTHRPGLDPRWEEFGHVATISLNRMGRKEMRSLVDRVTGGKALPESILEQILERTDGVPLFVEELIKTLLESKLVQEVDGQFVSEEALPSKAIPATLRDSLMARLDRLAPVKEVAQAAACIGREFSSELLTSIIDTPGLDEKLDQLVDSGLIFRRGSRDQGRFVFKHALVQDAAYESLLKARRRLLHARIAKLLEDEYSDRGDIEPELLAHHYTEADLAEPALRYWLRAGQQSTRQCAHAEAIAHLRRGLSIVDTLPQSEEKNRSEIEFRKVLGVPLMNKEGAASPVVFENYQRARALCEQEAGNENLYPVLWGLWFHHYIGSELTQATEMADQLLEVGENQSDAELMLEAHHCQWAVHYIGGDLGSALEHCNQGIKLYRPDEHHALTFTYGGHDPGVCALHVSGFVLWLMGYPEQSQQRLDSAYKLASELAHATTMASTLSISQLLHALRRDEDLLEQIAKELLQVAEKEKMHDRLTMTRGLSGWLMYRRGEQQEGLKLMRDLVDRRLELGTAWNSIPISLIAEILAGIGEQQEALSLLDENICLSQRDDVHWCEAELYRVKGVLLLGNEAQDPTAAEQAFNQAIEIAQRQQAKSLELRATVDLARLWQARGETDQARARLRPIYDWFTEGLDTADLVEARTLLEALA